jgi:poly-gamma-glutamate synthesis protein (capsule biosynthesis protein)
MIVSVRLMLIIAAALVLYQSPTANCGEPQEVTLYAVGDVMLGRYIAKVMAIRGSDYPFREITPALHTGDIVFGNLEAIISSDGATPLFPNKPYSFHASSVAAQALKNAGFHVLSLANNHAMDYGPDALAETRRLLSGKGIAVFGAGKDINEARRPVVITSHGMRFGFLGYGVAHSRKVYATLDRAGIVPIWMDDIRKDIQDLRKQCDVLIVSLHWGREYDTSPSQKQREESHQIIDWGADIIIGHHPHVMQGIEIYKNRVIAYSLGNFIFDQRGKGTDRSFILACRFRGKALYSAEIIPLDRYRSYFPKVADGQRRIEILQAIREISSPLNQHETSVSNVVFKQ